MAQGSSKIGDALFIQLGLTKDKWPQITVPLVQSFLDDPDLLENEDNNQDFVEAFYRYLEWWVRENGASNSNQRSSGIR